MIVNMPMLGVHFKIYYSKCYTFFSGVDIVYGGKCTANEDCTDANNVCTANKCACSPTSYKTDGTNKCAKSKICLLIYSFGSRFNGIDTFECAFKYFKL